MKVEHMDPFRGLNGQENKMSGLILLQNLQRIIQENDILKRVRNGSL